ncbi:rhamnulokinase [Microlunatus flavus]|uniref:Rhamnulokinase n=1 Tax=Microlunatus flavus TaxID=1036181 RepID=A0A1H9DA88_9ACTN|nr:rhamnulokinase family protein [Microlunatus flavus]SEQ10227.1 rhamnulokinase [Microlunatus flavus]
MSGATPVFAAVDIGASSGRVMAGRVVAGRVVLEEVHRFENGAVRSDGHLRWDLTGLFEQVLVGLRVLAERFGGAASIGIDTWAVDYGLLDAEGRLLAEPVAYRDARTDGVAARVHERLPAEDLYAVNGLQELPFTTLYQLVAERSGPLWPRARHALLLPDLLAYWLSGQARTEVTNASTTGLLDARTRTFDAGLLQALELPDDLFPALVQPGETLATITAEVAARTGLDPGTRVVAVGSHDTASAVVGVPAQGRDFAYVSSGTWSLVGVELDQPVLSEASRAANFTNEGGVDGRVRYLRNVGGLWLLQESLRTWREQGEAVDVDALLEQAAALPSGGPVMDVDDERFIAPGDLPARIRDACVQAGRRAPQEPAAVARCVLDSLAVAYARTVEQAVALSGAEAEVVHVVGGGSQNALLCQLTADLSGLPVLSGPVEATALGNVVVQARASGVLDGDLEALRTALRGSVSLRRHAPQRSAAVAAKGSA